MSCPATGEQNLTFTTFFAMDANRTILRRGPTSRLPLHENQVQLIWGLQGLGPGLQFYALCLRGSARGRVGAWMRGNRSCVLLLGWDIFCCAVLA